MGMVQHLLADRGQMMRISPVVGKDRFKIDKVDPIPILRGLGDFEARKSAASASKLLIINNLLG